MNVRPRNALRAIFVPLMLMTAPQTVLADGDGIDAVEMQTAMQRHIDRSSVDGAMLIVDPESGTLLELFTVNAHPMILEGPDHLVMCADLQDADGTRYPLDLYMVQSERGWQVFRTVINDRADLMRLVSDGVYSRL